MSLGPVLIEDMSEASLAGWSTKYSVWMLSRTHEAAVIYSFGCENPPAVTDFMLPYACVEDIEKSSMYIANQYVLFHLRA